ncbi:DoxX family protein [Pelagicoccus sp. SDUM812002]|uniref:DoxX family protein n=1 Tax=Pelagicoccus sp. SDUM812002 TaxID=3041266 RepID=UPI00280EB031|nr:DoxX family protein [Pelagicoccus sp. SDUM812002]MDQ8187364.1 DoxX family protein [Pelagicoccus sp. SDUM812002]
MKSPKLKILSWIAQFAAAAIMGQTLYFKFAAHPESVQLFTELGMEPHGRLLIGAFELIACVLLLIPSSIVYGALLGACLMAGAIIGHITELGWEGPRLQLGSLAIAVFACCITTLIIRRRELPLLKAIQTEKPTKRARPKD